MKRASCSRSRSRGGTMTTQKKEVLPLELITEILLRSPVKSVVRFKSVCKSWLSLISDPQFAKSHFELAASDADKLLLIVPSDHKAQSIDFNASLHDDSASHALNLNVLPPNYFHLEILGSCRGFILVIGRAGLTVWNPSTGFHVSVDWSPYVLSDPDFAVTTFLRGFGYDSSTDDYLVVLGSYNQNHRQEDCVTCVEYFSFRANAWKQFEPEPEAPRLCYQQCSNNQMGWLYNDAIHWLAFRCDVSMNVIVAFDLTGRSISEISMPVDFVYHNMKVCLLRVLRELLSLCTVGPTGSVEIWVMEKYKVQSSWTKTIVLSFENSPTVTCFFPICSTKSGDIVGADLGTKLVKCNDKGQLQEQRSYFNGPVGFAAAYLNGPVGYAASIFNGPDRYAAAVVYKESLLSFPCDSEQAS